MDNNFSTRIRNLVQEEIPNGLIKVLIAECNNYKKDEIIDKIATIVETGDVSNLDFGEINLNNENISFGEFIDRLFTDGVVWRSYVNNNEDEYAGILFGDGKFLSNFRWYGFQFSYSLDGLGDYGSCTLQTLRTLDELKASHGSKLEILKLYVKSASPKMYDKYYKDIDKYLEWFIQNHLSSNIKTLEDKKDFNSCDIVFEVSGRRLKETNLNQAMVKVSTNYRIIEGCLSTESKKVLSEEATKLFLNTDNRLEQLVAFSIAMNPILKGTNYEVKQNDIKTISAFE